MTDKTAALNQALKTQNRERILQLLNIPEIQQVLKIEDETRYTPLFWACSSLSESFAMEIVPLMLQKGADPFKKDIYRQDVLYYIAKHGKERLMEYLLSKYKFNLNENDQNHQTQIFFSVSNNQIRTTKMLIQNGANVNHIDKNGQNCFFWAASKGHLDMCRYLVECGTDYNLVDYIKLNPYMWAKKQKHHDVMKYLTDLKNMAKRAKQNNKIAQIQQNSQEQKGTRKKKQLMKQPYCLVYTNEKGEVHELTMQQLIAFSNSNQSNKNVMDLVCRPEKLENYPIPQQKKHQKVVFKILNHFIKHQQGAIFLYPVDPVALCIPHYPTIIKEPMDFTTIKNKLSFNAYDSEADFNRDMNLVFNNCVAFNGKESSLGKIATQMRLQFNTMYKKQFGI